MSAGLVALWAWIGAAGLIFDFLGFPDRLVRRLPFDSPVVAGLALALVIAVPYTFLSWLAWRGDRRTMTVSFGCGVVLLGWIAIQLAFLREVSFLHPMLASVGAAFAVVGRRGRSIAHTDVGP